MANGVFETMSRGGSCLCVKFEFLESSIKEILSDEDTTLYANLIEVIRAAKEDGQNMEAALKRKNEKIEELEKKLEVAEKELLGTKEVLQETKWNLKQAENDIKRLEKERIDMGL